MAMRSHLWSALAGGLAGGVVAFAVDCRRQQKRREQLRSSFNATSPEDILRRVRRDARSGLGDGE